MTDNTLDFKDLSAVYQESLLRKLRAKLSKPNHTIPTLSIHTMTKRKPRITDGIDHPVYRRKATPEELRR